jgi:hypothetical protein
MHQENNLPQRMVCLRVVFELAFLLSVGFLMVSCQTSPNTPETQAAQPQQLRLEIPKSNWLAIFFKDIDSRAEQAKLPNLRETILPNDDLEARLWFAAGSNQLNGIVIQRRSGTWLATYLHELSATPKSSEYNESMQPPRSGWDAFWNKIVDAGLLTIPDASQVDCNVFGKDGTGFIVETNVNRTYRTYLYDNPTFAKCDQARQLLFLINIVNEEFGLKWPTTK